MSKKLGVPLYSGAETDLIPATVKVSTILYSQ